MDVFTDVLLNARAPLRDAAVEAATRLDLWRPLAVPRPARALTASRSPHRVAALLDVLALEGLITRRCEGGEVLYQRAGADPPPLVPLNSPPLGWGRMADVIRSDRPLEADDPHMRFAFHRHLLEVGRTAADELANRFWTEQTRALLDAGSGAGVYAEAFLAADPARRATLIDRPEVLELARAHLQSAADRVTYAAGDIETAAAGTGHDAALLANVAHLHGPETVGRLVAACSQRLRVGGRLVIKDLVAEPDRSGPPTAIYFGLNMALYTESGRVYDPAELTGLLLEAGLVDIEAHRLETSADAAVLLGTKPQEAA